MTTPPRLDVQNLQSFFFTRSGLIKAVNDVSFSINQGETLALVGESGCGKSMTALSLLRLLPAPGKIVGGEVFLDDRDLLRLPDIEMRRIRGNDIAMIFQEPMTSLNPVLKIGEQIAEVLRLHKGLSQKAALKQAAGLLTQVGISDPVRRLRDYPHQLSGGQRQRIMIAIALACDPKLLIADEPTTALDVTIQAQIMDLLLELKQQRQMTMLLISHDLGIVAGNADKIAVMYAGQIVEYGSIEKVFHNPLHPYTQGLLQCIPRLGQRHNLPTIPGQLPDLRKQLTGCLFLDRCSGPCAPCSKQMPQIKEIEPGHSVRCWRY
ncbi:peptide/nickel transport system ATP-binding protein [Desulfuromusa kysingii]|uniref:Peptide/nickel transport system ATP-binding protein n=1 Tax=Desulfuromusa kysingii TaxID=37625 RepID=A0A1H3YJ22_9BACT|nr:ABC transporter ATP-binding protein [Desulfuromusa kysingii]SEA11533.1 peptide/nickel transport system ATP-binding protein [Desulfuromusa kysingii]